MKLDFLKNEFTRRAATQFFILKKSIPRSILAMRYLRGTGIEIGALHNPVPVGIFAKSKYLDRMSAADLVQEYPEMKCLNIVDPEIVDDGEKLTKVSSGSQNFIIANHFIEHCEDPIGTIKVFLDRLKDGGILYLAVPDKRFTFDKNRVSTSYEHLVADHENGPMQSKKAHYIDWAIHTSKDPNSENVAQKLMEKEYSIHFHVWTGVEFKEFLKNMINGYQLPLEIVNCTTVGDESIFLMRKTVRNI